MPFISASAISPYNSIRGGAEGGLVPVELLLDLYPNAAAAYSLRKLRTAYSGPAIEARKIVASETFVQDIGFVDNELDTASLLTFANGGDVFVAKWYDQSGNGNNDAVQVSQSAQPQIVSSGSVINENGKISIKFNGTTDYIQNELSIGPTVTAFAVSRIVSEPDYNFIYDSSQGSRVRLGLFVTDEYFADNGDGLIATATTPSNGLQNLFFAKHTNSNVSISVNQNTLKTTASTNFSQNTQYWVIGARNDGAEHFLEGTIQELILYPSDQSTNRAGIESNINSNYKIYWDGSQTGLLDDYPNAAAAYSLRALNSAYTGPAIEVRKTVGGVTSKLDINFRYDGSLDTASLLSFAEGGDVFVAKWYDQSGAGNNDVVQVSESAQPQIVSSGVVVTTSDNYAIDFSGSTKTLVNATFDNSTQVSSIFTIVKSTSSAPQVITDASTSASLENRQVSGFYAGNPSVFAMSKGISIKSATPINTNMNLLSTFFDVNSDLYLNGAKIIDSVNAGSNTREGLTLGCAFNTFAPFQGSIFEVIVFDEQNKSSDRVAIESNINNHYTIY